MWRILPFFCDNSSEMDRWICYPSWIIDQFRFQTRVRHKCVQFRFSRPKTKKKQIKCWTHAVLCMRIALNNAIASKSFRSVSLAILQIGWAASHTCPVPLVHQIFSLNTITITIATATAIAIANCEFDWHCSRSVYIMHCKICDFILCI